MPTSGELKKRRDKAREREAAIDKKIKQDKLRKEELEDELKEERAERAELRDHRADIKRELEREIEAEETGGGDEGRHDEAWEQRKEAKLDEIADLYEASEERSDRLIKKIVREDKDLAAHMKADKLVEGRIERLTKQIEDMAKDKEGQLSKDFHIREFDCRNGTKVPAYMEASLRDLCQNHLQPLRDSGGTVSINSGYRPAAYNASIGGEPNSYHIYDLRKSQPAADHVQAGRAAPSVAAWHESHHDGTIGLGRYASFTHIDTRNYESRWSG